MRKHLIAGLLALCTIGLIAFCYPKRISESPPQQLQLPDPTAWVERDRPAATPPTADAAPTPMPDFASGSTADAPPSLPPLGQSDELAKAVLAEAVGEAFVAAHIPDHDLIRKLVATTDNLTREALWINARFIPALGGLFLAAGEDEDLHIAGTNYARYAPLFRLIDAIDVAALTAVYQRHYPLLQAAYEELGYPGQPFHNRALEVVAHLLATPRIEGPIRLVRPHVLYHYAEPALENLSSGQKILLRVGPDNAAIARTKLIQLRVALEQLSGWPPAD